VLLHVSKRFYAPDVEACCGAASAPDFGGGAMEGGGAGGLGKGPFLPLLTGTEAPMLKLVPAGRRHTCSKISHLKADHDHMLVTCIQGTTQNECIAVRICSVQTASRLAVSSFNAPAIAGPAHVSCFEPSSVSADKQDNCWISVTPTWSICACLVSVAKLGICTKVKPKNGHCLRMAIATLLVITYDIVWHCLFYCLSSPMILPVVTCDTASH